VYIEGVELSVRNSKWRVLQREGGVGSVDSEITLSVLEVQITLTGDDSTARTSQGLTACSSDRSPRTITVTITSDDSPVHSRGSFGLKYHWQTSSVDGTSDRCPTIDALKMPSSACAS
jgi:hypothetical protein